jgi:hypothetical protein
MKIYRYLILLLPTLLASCTRAPSFNILGSYFPAWLFCLIVGICLTVAARAIFRKYKVMEALNPPLLMYSCLTAFFTFALWLIFFRS